MSRLVKICNTTRNVNASHFYIGWCLYMAQRLSYNIGF